jgi:hypothetical protein
VVHIARANVKNRKIHLQISSSALSSSSSPIYLSYQGGGDIGVFMIQALKGAFMGYIGLLLNDPYKRDRIDG